ncbi:MAG: hypothetical protein R8G33_07595 [Gammaproteobacteria bacterium]|nr:hypothetical protein [Gammaproteobacteria bacterium]
MKILIQILVLFIAHLSVTIHADDNSSDEENVAPTKISRVALPVMISTAGKKYHRQDLIRLCEPCEKYIDIYTYTRKTLVEIDEEIRQQKLTLKRTNRKLSDNRDKDGTDEYQLILNQRFKENQGLKNLILQREEVMSTLTKNYNNLIKCIYEKCMADAFDAGYKAYEDSFLVDVSLDKDEVTNYFDTNFEVDDFTYSPISKVYLLTITKCKECKHKSNEINQWILDNYDENLQLPENLKGDNASSEEKELFRNKVRKFIRIIDEMRAELRQCEKQCIKKDKSHGSILPEKRKTRYYAAAGVSHVKSEDLRESINSGKEIFAANGIDGNFNSDSHDFGYKLILGAEIPLQSGSLIDVSVFFQDGVEIRGDVSGTAATLGGPFTFDSTGKQEIKVYGVNLSYLHRLTENFYFGGGLGYHLFDIVDESNVITTLNGVTTSSVASRTSEHENVVSAIIKARYKIGKYLIFGIDASRTLDKVGFNEEHVTSVDSYVGVRF